MVRKPPTKDQYQDKLYFFHCCIQKHKHLSCIWSSLVNQRVRFWEVSLSNNISFIVVYRYTNICLVYERVRFWEVPLSNNISFIVVYRVQHNMQPQPLPSWSTPVTVPTERIQTNLHNTTSRLSAVRLTRNFRYWCRDSEVWLITETVPGLN